MISKKLYHQLIFYKLDISIYHRILIGRTGSDDLILPLVSWTEDTDKRVGVHNMNIVQVRESYIQILCMGMISINLFKNAFKGWVSWKIIVCQIFQVAGFKDNSGSFCFYYI